jgi:ectoine hydroxylase-related dioxygenase (phytanoyl-CoA dioxygenase family)
MPSQGYVGIDLHPAVSSIIYDDRCSAFSENEESGIVGDLPKPFREIHPGDLDSSSVRNEMDSQGYCLLRGLLPSADVHRLLAEITQIVNAAGWLLPAHPPLERLADTNAACGEPDPSFKLVYDQVFNLEAFHAFAHHPALRQVMTMLVGPQLLIHPKPIARLMFPNCERFVVHAHQDHTAIGGDPESFTAWMPLHDCPLELGSLQILEASHRYGLQSADPGTGIISKETARGGKWLGGRINAGDVLIFHSLTVHAACPNTSNRLRISMDCRFQDYGRPLNPATLVFPGASNGEKSWETTYANWRSGDLKYYWKRLPLRFKPSKVELAQLAQTADSPAMRSRYANILSQLDAG